MFNLQPQSTEFDLIGAYNVVSANQNRQYKSSGPPGGPLDLFFETEKSEAMDGQWDVIWDAMNKYMFCF